MSFKANLPMYDWPEVSSSLDQFWQLMSQTLTKKGYALPNTLDRQAAEAIWQDEQLVLSQTCGFPLVHKLGLNVRLLGTPTYNCEHFVDGHYASVVLARNNDARESLPEFAGATIAINSLQSQSGFNALRNLLIDRQLVSLGKPGFFAKMHLSGGHRYSMQAVEQNVADVCAIDPVSYALAKKFDPASDSLKIIDLTAATPGLPLVCNRRLFSEQTEFEQWKSDLHIAWQTAASDPIAKPLLLDSIIDIPRKAYEAVPCHDLSLLPESI